MQPIAYVFMELFITLIFKNVSLSCQNEFLEIDTFRSLQKYINIYFMLQNDKKTCIYDSSTCKWILDKSKCSLIFFSKPIHIILQENFTSNVFFALWEICGKVKLCSKIWNFPSLFSFSPYLWGGRGGDSLGEPTSHTQQLRKLIHFLMVI